MRGRVSRSSRTKHQTWNTSNKYLPNEVIKAGNQPNEVNNTGIQLTELELVQVQPLKSCYYLLMSSGVLCHIYGSNELKFCQINV